MSAPMLDSSKLAVTPSLGEFDALHLGAHIHTRMCTYTHTLERNMNLEKKILDL